MKVKELIEYLKTFNQELPVAVEKFSEQLLLEKSHLSVESLCLPRPDGWIGNARPDKPLQEYLTIEGN